MARIWYTLSGNKTVCTKFSRQKLVANRIICQIVINVLAHIIEKTPDFPSLVTIHGGFVSFLIDGSMLCI